MWCTTLHQGQFHRFLFFCYVLLCYVLWCDVPPFIKVNSIDSYSFVMYCYVMYCYVIYHPSSRSIPPLLIFLLCIVLLCIVRSRTTLHHSQFHQVKVIRNSEVLFPNFLWLWYDKIIITGDWPKWLLMYSIWSFLLQNEVEMHAIFCPRPDSQNASTRTTLPPKIYALVFLGVNLPETKLDIFTICRRKAWWLPYCRSIPRFFYVRFSEAWLLQSHLRM